MARVSITTSWQFFSRSDLVSQGSAYAWQIALYGDSVSNAAFTLYAWGGQATRANRLGPYVKTVAAAVGGPLRNLPAERENLVLQSEAFDTSPWSKGTGITVTEGTGDVADPLGTFTSSKVTYDGAGAAGGMELTQTLTTVARATYTVSIWARTASGSRAYRLDPTAFSLQSITLTTTWTQFSLSGTAADDTALTLALLRAVADNDANVTIYLWGAHVTRANRLGPYVKTTAAAVIGPIRNAATARSAVSSRQPV